MTNLSPAAQVILDALYMDELNGPERFIVRAHVAAALRAAADQLCLRWSDELSHPADVLNNIANELEAQ